MRYLSGSSDKGEGHMFGRQFRLNDLGLRCMAEHVTRAITLSLLQPDTAVPGTPQPVLKTLPGSPPAAQAGSGAQ
jgi:hypothetical protein